MKKAYRIKIIANPSLDLCDVLSKMQKAVWGMEDYERMPPWKIFITPKLGGLLIVAYDNKVPIAHALFTHAHQNLLHDPYLYMDMIGVLKEYQGFQFGEKIILKSKEILSNTTYTSIQWTYDPLEGANANLYIRKLGAVVTNYYPNYYGQLSGKRHQGTPTDRFWVKLSDDSEPKHYERFDLVIERKNYSMYESKISKNPPIIGIEIPVDFQSIVRDDPIEAIAVRQSTRQIFQSLLVNDYRINGFTRIDKNNFYIAEKFL